MHVMQKILSTAAVALAFIGAPAQAQFTFQRATFESQVLHGNTLHLSFGDAVSGGTSGSGDTGGMGSWATLQSPSVANHLAKAACTGNGDQKGTCLASFQFPAALTDSKTQASGGLQSQDVSSTTASPEPNTYVLVLAGLGTIAFIVRRRRVIG